MKTASAVFIRWACDPTDSCAFPGMDLEGLHPDLLPLHEIPPVTFTCDTCSAISRRLSGQQPGTTHEHDEDHGIFLSRENKNGASLPGLDPGRTSEIQGTGTCAGYPAQSSTYGKVLH